VLTTVDYHTAGEPFRIVTAGAPVPEGGTVLDRRAAAQTGELDRVRALLCNEPRGHADMYGGFLVPPDDEGAHVGVLFWHKDGFSTACGHGTIALATYLVDDGAVDVPADGSGEVVIDVPSGRVTAVVSRSGGRVTGVRFRNVASYVVARGLEVRTSRGVVHADISYGGAMYASVDARSAGLTVSPADLTDLIAVGREIKWALDASPEAQHRDDPRLSGVYGTIWFEDAEPLDGAAHQRNVTVFADGEVDRSPCGSGTSARLALLHDSGDVTVDRPLVHDSIVGTTFVGRVLGQDSHGGVTTVATEIEGAAYRTGEHRFVLDPHDPVGEGFQLR
jgi:proline racemase